MITCLLLSIRTQITICKGAIVETAYGTKVVTVVGFSNILKLIIKKLNYF